MFVQHHTVSPSGGAAKHSVGRFARKLACVYRERIVQAEAPSGLISAASPGRASDACTDLEILRLCRRIGSRRFAQEGVELERLTLANWAEETSALFAVGGSAAASCDERD
jgi:hypothetical protein